MARLRCSSPHIKGHVGLVLKSLVPMPFNPDECALIFLCQAGDDFSYTQGFHK